MGRHVCKRKRRHHNNKDLRGIKNGSTKRFAAADAAEVFQEVSKPSAAEAKYLDVIRKRMAEGDLKCVCTGRLAHDPHHPLGSFWESGKALKAHD